jgi:hypothetical protein
MRVRALGALAVGGGLLALSLMTLTQAVAASGPSSAAAAPTCPSFSPSTFHKSTRITNQYFPLTPGDLYSYKGHVKKQAVVDTVYVTANAPIIDGVRTVEVRDRVYDSDANTNTLTLTEDTLDWYAQDDQGNVWYFGELATQYPAGTHDGSWTAGVDGAQPGYIMEATPRVGDSYCQENAPGVAEDAAQVLSLTTSRSVPYGSFANVLQTKDYSLIEPHSEHKFYARGVGMLEAIALNGGSEDIQLYTIEHNQ